VCIQKRKTKRKNPDQSYLYGTVSSFRTSETIEIISDEVFSVFSFLGTRENIYNISVSELRNSRIIGLENHKHRVIPLELLSFCAQILTYPILTGEFVLECVDRVARRMECLNVDNFHQLKLFFFNAFVCDLNSVVPLTYRRHI